MVLVERVGKKRSFALGLLLTFLTFGIYAVFWNYRAHNELYRQFELQREARDEGMVWYVLGLVVPPFLLAYLWVFSANVAYLRDRMGLPKRITPGKFVLFLGLGVGALASALLTLEIALLAKGPDPTEEQVSEVLTTWGPAALALATLAAVILALAYHRLQRDINDVWDAWTERMAFLSRHPEATYAPSASVARDPYADLRVEWERLRAEHPELQATGSVEGLLLRASAGDDHARDEASVLVRDLEALLDERRGLLAKRVDASETERAALDERLAVLDLALFGDRD